MTSLRVSPIDAAREADPSKTATAQTQQVIIPRETQQRFEHLMQPELNPTNHARMSEKVQTPNQDVDENSNSEHVVDHFSQLPGQPESSAEWTAQEQSTEHHQPELADTDCIVPPTCSNADDSASLEVVDNAGTDRPSAQPGEQPVQPQASSPLPTPLELVSRVAGSSDVHTVSTQLSSVTVETRLIDLVRAVADRILISDVVYAPQEVHIHLKETILPGTEIRLSEQAGFLQVRFVTDQPSSLEFLTRQQAALSTQLEQTLTQHVIVYVDFESLSHSSSHQQFPSHGHQDSRHELSRDSGQGARQDSGQESARERDHESEQDEADAE